MSDSDTPRWVSNDQLRDPRYEWEPVGIYGDSDAPIWVRGACLHTDCHSFSAGYRRCRTCGEWIAT